MKYRQLTKEQLETLHQEFAQFLASQSIDVKEWSEIKKEKPSLAEDEMNIFSDLVWEDVLNRIGYIDHFSKKTINLFFCDENELYRIVVKVNKNINLSNEEDYRWLLKNTNDNAIEYFTGKKTYDRERNVEIFDLIEKGATISNGELFKFFKEQTSFKTY